MISRSTNNGNSDGGNSSNNLYTALCRRVAGLEFGSFQRLVLFWLYAKGYHHVRAQIAEDKRGVRSGQQPGQVEDANAVEGPGLHSGSVLRNDRAQA